MKCTKDCPERAFDCHINCKYYKLFTCVNEAKKRRKRRSESTQREHLLYLKDCKERLKKESTGRYASIKRGADDQK